MKHDKQYGVDAGTLRHKVNINNYSESGVSDRGHKQGSWQTTHSNIPASIEFLTGREAEIAHQIVASADYKITLRYLPNVTETSQIVWDDHVFNIVKVNNVQQRNRKLICFASEKK